jgi:hypothetical protein
MTREHDDLITLKVLRHYEDHPNRENSPEFERIKRDLHERDVPCFINNGRCEGNLEIHHSIIEYSAQNNVDWAKVKIDYPSFDHVDDKDQMMVLCEKHHRYPYFGVHTTDYPTWILQKYMNEEALEDFERAVEKAKQARK